jgi:hypothetical protein
VSSGSQDRSPKGPFPRSSHSALHTLHAGSACRPSQSPKGPFRTAIPYVVIRPAALRATWTGNLRRHPNSVPEPNCQRRPGIPSGMLAITRASVTLACRLSRTSLVASLPPRPVCHCSRPVRQVVPNRPVERRRESSRALFEDSRAPTRYVIRLCRFPAIRAVPPPVRVGTGLVVQPVEYGNRSRTPDAALTSQSLPACVPLRDRVPAQCQWDRSP